MSPAPFSDRHGLRPNEPLIYDAAPEGLRYGLREVLHELGFERPTQQRGVMCRAMRIRPDPNNWSDYPNVEIEVNDLISVTPWYRFFDMLERIPRFLGDEVSPGDYIDLMNQLFADERLGYRFAGQQIERVGTDEFDEAVTVALDSLQEDRMSEPRRQFVRACEFRNDRPPDWSNAIKEAVNSVEGAMQIIYNRPGVSLTTIISNDLPADVPNNIKRIILAL